MVSVKSVKKVNHQFVINIAAQNLKMNKGEKSEKAIKKHAEEWIKANESTFNSWIN